MEQKFNIKFEKLSISLNNISKINNFKEYKNKKIYKSNYNVISIKFIKLKQNEIINQIY